MTKSAKTRVLVVFGVFVVFLADSFGVLTRFDTVLTLFDKTDKTVTEPTVAHMIIDEINGFSRVSTGC